MPGIVGIITKKPPEWARPQVDRMVEAIRHETFYSSGRWDDDALGIYVGWVALKNSFADSMPLQHKGSELSMVFSGEESNHPNGTRNSDSVEDHRWGKPSYLLRLYEEDARFPACLNGMFHGLVADRVQRTATLFNDRYGMHRLYYHQAVDAFYFAVEAKAILAARPELREPSARGIGEFVACSCVLGDRTIFKDIYALPGGSSWTFRNGMVERKSSYFSVKEWEEQEVLDAGSYYEELRAALTGAMEGCFVGPERIGVALTGGLDTRVIMAMHAAPAGALACYTFGGMIHECQDVRVAKKIAQVNSQPHQVILVGEEFLKSFPHYAERSVYLTEGGCDVYRASDLYVSEKARGIAPVKIVGTYGSEILRHAVMFKPMATADGLFSSEFIESVEQARVTYAESRCVHPVTFAAFRQSPWYHHGILALEQTQLTVRSPYLDNKFVQTVFRAPKVEDGAGDVRLRLIADGSQVLCRIPSDRGVGGSSGTLSTALSHGFLEFTFKAEYGYDYGMPQWVAWVDHLLSPLRIDRLFLGRHKFLHYRVWYRDQLADYVRQMLLDPLTLSRPYIEPKVLERRVHAHLKGTQNHTAAIHKVLTLELLQRQFFD